MTGDNGRRSGRVHVRHAAARTSRTPPLRAAEAYRVLQWCLPHRTEVAWGVTCDDHLLLPLPVLPWRQTRACLLLFSSPVL